MVGVVCEPGEVPGAGHRVGVDQRGRADLLVQVGIAIERELHQGAGEHRALAPEHGEHRPRQLGGAPDVQQTHLGGELPVGNALVPCVTVGAEILDPQHRIVLRPRSDGAVHRRQVRHPQQQLLETLPQGVGLRRHGPALVAQHPAAIGGLGGLGRTALTVQPTDLTGELLHLVPQLVAARQQVPAPHVEVERLGQRGGVVTAGSHAGTDALHLVAQQANVEHHKTVSERRPEPSGTPLSDGVRRPPGAGPARPRTRSGHLAAWGGGLEAGGAGRDGVAPGVLAVALHQPAIDLLQRRLLPGIGASGREA